MLSISAYGTAALAQAADTFLTPEYQNSTGLHQIRAAQGYGQVAGRQGGEGVVIAIVDEGIDESHPELAPNLVGSFYIGDRDIPGQHGTAVAGIAAGARNNNGVMGVAFNAGIVAYQAGSANPNNPNSAVLDTNAIATSIRAAAGGFDIPNTEADIINMSLGSPLSGPLLLNTGEVVAANENAASPAIEASLRFAVGNDKLVVVSAGNDFSSLPAFEDSLGLPRGTIVDIGADFPAQFASRPDLSNGMIAVMAVDANNRRASFSNSCLGVANRCLAAPGVNFQGALPGGGIGNIGSGTSYAAPMVSGAAAVVQAAFGVTPQEAGNRLLSTATDLGAAGTDQVFGRGLLNLENALSPQGTLVVATTTSADGPRVTLADSRLALGSSLALNGDGAALLSRAVTLDDDNFPFAVDLGKSAKVQSRTTGLNAFVGSTDLVTKTVSAEGATVALTLDEAPELDAANRAEFAKSDTALQEERARPSMQLQSELGDGIDMFLAINGSSQTSSGLVTSLPDGGDFFQPTTFLSPYDQLAGSASGGGTSLKISENTELSISAFTGSEEDGAREALMQKVELAHKTVGDVELRFSYGLVQESGGFLGSETTGAFGASSGGNSQYIDLSVLAPLSKTVSLFGGYSQGRTSASARSASLLSNYSTLRSEAFGAGLVMTGVAEEGDGLSMMIGQPLRVAEGSADVTVPVGRTEDGRIVQERGTLDLSPDGREIAFEAVYKFALDDEDQSLSAGSFLRLNPDHDPNADPDLGFGIKYQLSF
ncbi:MAG: S8 family peptidase [Geminicoccaceae bacterium]